MMTRACDGIATIFHSLLNKSLSSDCHVAASLDIYEISSLLECKRYSLSIINSIIVNANTNAYGNIATYT